MRLDLLIPEDHAGVRQHLAKPFATIAEAALVVPQGVVAVEGNQFEGHTMTARVRKSGSASEGSPLTLTPARACVCVSALNRRRQATSSAIVTVVFGSTA